MADEARGRHHVRRARRREPQVGLRHAAQHRGQAHGCVAGPQTLYQGGGDQGAPQLLPGDRQRGCVPAHRYRHLGQHEPGDRGRDVPRQARGDYVCVRRRRAHPLDYYASALPRPARQGQRDDGAQVGGRRRHHVQARQQPQGHPELRAHPHQGAHQAH